MSFAGSASIRLPLLLPIAALACGPVDGRERFERDVVPVLEHGCLSGTCHGVRPGERESGAYLVPGAFYVDVDSAGAIRDVDEAYGIAKDRIDTVGRASFSTLLRKPLEATWGGLPHRGGAVFPSPADDGYRAILRWIESESGGGESRSIDDLPETERFFATDVLPLLRDAGCFVASCHGPTSIAFTALHPPADPATGEFAVADVQANYATLRKFLHLGGDPLLGRLVRKPLPPEAGGIAHRGGNDVFFTGRTEEDPRARREVKALVDWTRREQADLAEGPPGQTTAIVFVRGPATPARLGDLDGFVPGSDLWRLSPPEPEAVAENLTAGAHDGPADVRDPSVSHDGTRVAFAMRTGDDDCFHLYEMDFATRAIRARTQGACDLAGGGRLADRWPAYGPDGRLYFASTRAGILREHADGLDADLWSVGDDPSDLVRVTWTPSPELSPTFFSAGKTRGEIAFTVLRRLGDRFEGVLFRFPLCHDPAHHGEPEYHVHHGVTSGADAEYHARQLPDGREAIVLLDRDAAFEAGDLAILERSFGPDLVGGTHVQPSVPDHRHAISALDAGAYRDPMPMPDGSILVAHAPGDVDPLDPDAVADFRIERIALEEVRGVGPTIVSREVLSDAPGLWDTAPVPVWKRPLEEDPHPIAWTPGAPTGTIAYRHLRTLEAIFRNPTPTGGLPFPDGIAWVRLVESVDARPGDVVPVDPTEVLDGDPQATSVSNGVHGPARILAELPALADTSFVYEVPSDVPFRIEALDADRMAIGAQQNRWIFVNGGETFPGGISEELFPQTCGPCHGSASGDPEDVVVTPDVVSSASITLATHENLNPRRPIPPLAVGDGTRIEVDFRRDVQPILDRSCALAGCHRDPTAAAGLVLEGTPTLHYSRSYESLLARGDGSAWPHEWVDERGTRARHSALVERILGRELDAPADVTDVCPPPDSDVSPLGEDEVATIVRWIELGATFRGPGAP